MSDHLKGIRVVELGTHVAVPKATRTMADWGAEVIKVEPPTGEAWRFVGPGYEMPAKPDNNPIFQVENMNKKSIAIDLKEPKGQKVMLDLIKNADVFITNTRPKALEKLGLGYENLKKECPKLIYVHFTAYGPKGPEKDFPGFDISAFWAKSGAPVEWSLEGVQPFKPQPGFGDSTAASIMLNGILAALIRREKTGKGDCIDASLYAAALWCNSIGMICGQPKYNIKFPKKMYTDPLVPPYQSKDGAWVMAADPVWTKLYPKVFALIGLEKYIGTPLVDTRDHARENYNEVCKLIANAFGKYTADELMTMFSQNGIVCARFTSPNEIYKDEQAWANDFLAKVNLQNGDELVVPRVPIQFGSSEAPALSLAPDLGVDTEEILSGIGYTKTQIDAFLNK